MGSRRWGVIGAVRSCLSYVPSSKGCKTDAAMCRPNLSSPTWLVHAAQFLGVVPATFTDLGHRKTNYITFLPANSCCCVVLHRNQGSDAPSPSPSLLSMRAAPGAVRWHAQPRRARLRLRPRCLNLQRDAPGGRHRRVAIAIDKQIIHRVKKYQP